jgi:ATP-dependent RNA helicase SUPV3L1/SUV3
MLERLADMIRPLLAWRANRDPEAKPPKGSTGDGGFVATPEMMSILGCSPEELGKVLKGLGFRLDRRPVKAAASKVQDLPAVPDQAASPDNVSAAAEAAPQPQDEPAALETAGPPHVDAAATTDAAPPAPGEVQFEEVWRPRRHHREGHERGEGRPEHRRRDRRHGRRPGGGAPENAAAVQSGEAASAGTPAAPGVNAEAGPAGHRPQGGGKRDQSHRPANRDKRGERRDDRPAGSRPEHGPRKEGRRDEQRREPRRDQRRDDRREPRTLTAAPPRGKGSVESDSPFASLLALRSQLEQARRDKS